MSKKNRKPKDYEFSTMADEDYDDDNPCVITEEDGTKRATRPGEVQRMLVGEELAAARLADPTLRTDYEEHMENRRRASVPAHTAGLSASETGNAATPLRPAHTAGSEGTAHQATTTPPQKSSVTSTTKSPKDPRPCKKTSPPATPSATLEQQYTYAEAIRLMNVQPNATTDEEFRKELADFWDNWRVLNLKKEGRTPKAWSPDWKNYKVGNILLARYRKFSGGIIQRELASLAAQAAQTVVVNVATIEPTPAAEEPSSTTDGEAQAAQQPAANISDSDQADRIEALAAPEAVPEAVVDLLPVLSADEIDLDLLAPAEGTQAMDAEAMERIAADLLSDRYDEILDYEVLESGQVQRQPTPEPPQQPAHTAGAEGETSTEAAHTAAPVAGDAGEGVEVPSTSTPQPTDASKPPAGQKARRKASKTTGRLSPGLERHRERHAKKEKQLIPVIDPRVYKDSAAQLSIQKVPPTPWVNEFQHKDYEYLGNVCALQVPWAYLPDGTYNDLPNWRKLHTLKDVTVGHVIAENKRLPHRYILTYTFGIDPWLWKTVNEQTRQELTAIALQKYWEPCPGIKFHVGGIGPTGFNLRSCRDYNGTFHGQRKALTHLAHAAAESGKCLSIRIDKDEAGGSINLHEEARKAIRAAGIKSEHPIHLQNLRATYHHLCDWLEEFPNAVVAFEFNFLAHLEDIVDDYKDTLQDPRYVEADGMFLFIKAAPLRNIMVQSGAYNPGQDDIPIQPSHHSAAADLLQRITRTPAAVYLEHSAINAARLYNLNQELFDRALHTPDPGAALRSTIPNLRTTIETALQRLAAEDAEAAQAPRADPDGQEDMEQQPTEDRPAHTAGGPPEDTEEMEHQPTEDRPAHTAGGPPDAAESSAVDHASDLPEGTEAAVTPSEKVEKPPSKKAKYIRRRSRSVSSRSSSNSSDSSLSTGSSRSSRSRTTATHASGTKDLRESLKDMLKSGLGGMVKGVTPPRSTRRSRSRSRDKESRRSRSRSREENARRSRSRSRRSRDRRSRSRSSRRSGRSSRRSRRSRDRRSRSRSSRRSGRSNRSGSKWTRRDEEDRRERDRKRHAEWEREDRRQAEFRRESERRRQDELHEDERRERDDRRKREEQRKREERRPDDRYESGSRRDKKDKQDGARTSRSGLPTPQAEQRERSPSSRDTSVSYKDPTKQFARPAAPTERKPRQPVRAPSPGPRDSSLASSRASSADTRDQSFGSSRASSALSRVYTDRQHGQSGRVMIPAALSTAHTAVAPYQTINRRERRPAHTAGVVPTVRRTTVDNLFKAQPLPPAFTLCPTEDVLNNYVEDCFGTAKDPERRLRGVLINELRTQTIDPAQPETFAVPPEKTWNPTERCTRASEERSCFHPAMLAAKWIPVKRWKTTPTLQDPALQKALLEIGDMKIYTLGHMILVSWAVRLKNKDDRVNYIVLFLHRVLQTFDWEKRIPELLAQFQPDMCDGDTRTPWPEFYHFKQGSERWMSSCEFAYRYLFDHLSGPLVFDPRWLQTANVDQDCRRTIREDMLHRADELFNELRHVIYRQYGLRHIKAELTNETIYWQPYASHPERDSTRHEKLLLGQTVVFAEEPVYHAFSPRLRDDVEMIALRDGNRAAIRASILNCFPSDAVHRVVFWFGRNFIVEGNYDDFDKLIQELCRVYSKYFGNVEVFVVLPPYARTHRAQWMHQALRLFVEQEDLLPFARVALYANDLQYYDRDRRLGVATSWLPSFSTSEDGCYLTNLSVERRKEFLRKEHGLNLWTDYPKLRSSDSQRLLDYASTPIPDTARADATTTTAPSTRPSSAASQAAWTSALVGPSGLPTPQAERASQSAPLTIVQALPGPSTSAAADPNSMAFVQSAVTNFMQLQAQHMQQSMSQFMAQLATIQVPRPSHSKPKKSRSRHEDQYSDRSD